MSQFNPDGSAAILHPTNNDPLHSTKYDFPRDHVGYGRASINPQWPNNAKIAISFVINYEEGGERSVQFGDGQSESRLWELSQQTAPPGDRAPNPESDFDYGSRVGIWRLLNCFEKHKMPITVYAVGQAFEKNPEVAKAFSQNGHEVASHGYKWITYHGMEPELEKQLIYRQLEAIKNTTGNYPEGWDYGAQSPHSKALVWEVYKEMGTPLLYNSDTYADDLPYWTSVPAEKNSPNPEGMLMIPYSFDVNDFRFHSPSGFSTTSDFYTYMREAFDVLYEEGCEGMPKMMSIGLHCRISGKPGRFAAVKQFVEYISGKEGVWITTRKDIAKHWREKFPYKE